MTDTDRYDAWANRWLGGMCALGALEGLPIRGADYDARPLFSQAMRFDGSGTAGGTHEDAIAAYESLLGCGVVLARSVQAARRLVLAQADVGAGDRIVLPANATRSLVEAVKHASAEPLFAPLDAGLQLQAPAAAARAVWTQPVAGLPLNVAPSALPVWLDQTDSLPRRAPGCELAIYGLHLSDDERHNGALVASRDRTLIEALRSRLSVDDLPDAGVALAQHQRLERLIAAQSASLDETRFGLEAACGLEVIDPASSDALAHGVAVRAPDECDASTFYAYVSAENTPVSWFPTLRPVHYRAAAEQVPTAQHLSRWFLVPVAPGAGEEELAHGVLGIAKAADYLGVRWRQDRERAAWYADLMQQMYGPGHDAYRPAFEL